MKCKLAITYYIKNRKLGADVLIMMMVTKLHRWKILMEHSDAMQKKLSNVHDNFQLSQTEPTL